ncbi:MAG: GyrI-like domain-containing protein [Oscillospiraceae bacterium]|jgi:hypothetical protein|nr:GyrI-like domain-containing protein [Oscillospiraceae bacterium]
MPIDFKKTEKELYQPKTVPSIIDVPEIVYFAIDGQGDPNTSAAYQSAVEALYSLSYTIKMSYKSGNQPSGFYEYVVPPLEGFWTVGDDFYDEQSIADKSKFLWTSVIRQPEFVTEEVFGWAKETLANKKPNVDTSKVYLWKFSEGLCVQIMHIGSYDTESITIQKLTEFTEKSGYQIDMSENRRHHEIYLGDPRKTVPEKLKTVIRHPIRKG